MKRLCTKWLYTAVVAVVYAASIHGTAMAKAQAASKLMPKAGAEILSDTMGVDFSGYIRRLQEDIQHNWDPMIPAKANSPESKKGITVIRFSILPSGKIGSMTLETRSGDVALDRAAWYAITNEGRFPRLPREFHGPQIELRIGFFYNIPIPPAK